MTPEQRMTLDRAVAAGLLAYHTARDTYLYVPRNDADMGERLIAFGTIPAPILNAARAYYRLDGIDDDAEAALGAALAKYEPPIPPTADEMIAVLRAMVGAEHAMDTLKARRMAFDLLARVPK